MFYDYLIAVEDKKPVLLLYVSSKFEISSTLDVSSKKKNIYVKVKDYIDDNKINFKGDRVNFIKDGVMLGHINLSDYDYYYNSLIEVIDNKFVVSKSLYLLDKVKINNYIYKRIIRDVPITFNIEVLKALAITIRTEVYKKLNDNIKLEDIDINKDYLRKSWSINYDKYKDKVLDAINDTDNIVIMYDNNLINSYYHLSSNGKTEDSSNILNTSYPYLISVDSDFDDKENYKIVDNSYLSKLLNMKIDKSTKVNVVMRTSGDRVKYIKFDDKIFDGLVLSKRLGLNSNDFKVKIGKGYATFTVYGHGDGLGLSEYGAEELAKKGYNYKKILEHFYPKTYLENIKEKRLVA